MTPGHQVDRQVAESPVLRADVRRSGRPVVRNVLRGCAVVEQAELAGVDDLDEVQRLWM